MFFRKKFKVKIFMSSEMLDCNGTLNIVKDHKGGHIGGGGNFFGGYEDSVILLRFESNENLRLTVCLLKNVFS